MRTIRAAVLRAADCDSPDSLTRIVCNSVAADPTVILVRIWLAQAGPDLKLSASAGCPTGGGSYHRIDGSFARVVVGVGKIGQLAATQAPFIIRNVRGDEDWLTNPGWSARQGVRAFVGLPLTAAGACVGVLALFSRATLADEDIEELRFLADFTAVRLRVLRSAPPPGLLTRKQLRELEKRSIEAALAQTRGKIFGAGGAAALLDVKPTTLASRIKALAIDPR